MQRKNLLQRGGLIAGIDEAGRGPLAGPVVAAAVVLPAKIRIIGLADSKKLSAQRRESLAITIKDDALAWSVAWADAAEIDAMNVLAASMLAMRRAILGLVSLPRKILVDGNCLPNLVFGNLEVEGQAIVGGDDKVAAISAASIIAKTTRDRMMLAMDKIYPIYEFARHKGYPTEIHRDKLREHGPCREHRQSFAPVRAVS
jgi:ribonuclease HII